MKEQIKTEDREQFYKLGKIFTILLIAVILTPIPLVYFFSITLQKNTYLIL